MTEKFLSITNNSETRMANFFQSVCTNSVSINLIESELSNEKSRRRKLDNDRRELKCKIKELVEKLKATEILLDISNAAIQALEKAMEDSAQPNTPAAAPFFTAAFKPTGGFGDLFEPKEGTWKCKSCYVCNSADKTECVSCQNPNPKSTAAAQQNTPALMPFFSSALEPASGFGQFGDLLKPKEGWWKCKSCYVANKSGDIKCGACKTPKPFCTAAQQNTPATTPLFSSASKPTGGFGNLFEPKEGTWECKSCYVRNNTDKTKCVSCNKENGMRSATKPAASVCGTSGFNASGASKFGSSNTPKSTFLFGTPKSGSEFFFGTKSESQPATFFGQSLVSSKAKETANIVVPLSSIIGGASQKIDKKNNASEQGIFSSATNFTFKDLAKSQTELKEFAFESPQKYEFSFDSVRPSSPCKAPKSPAAPSDADEEDEVEDSDTDNLYFEPVIPLPPKVEVKTGEEEEKVLFCKRAKLFRFYNSEWKERGIGDIKILLDEKTNMVRLLMRREQVLKVCLNHHLTKDIKFEWRNDKSLSWTATNFAENEPSPELLAVRFKTKEFAEEFKKAINDALKVSCEPAPSPKSESISLKPASAFSFKTDDPVNVQSQGFSFSSLSSRFGGSPQQSQTVFGSAVTGFSFKDPKGGCETSPFSFSLKDNVSTGFSFNEPSVFGGFEKQVVTNAAIQVSEKVMEDSGNGMANMLKIQTDGIWCSEKCKGCSTNLGGQKKMVLDIIGPSHREPRVIQGVASSQSINDFKEPQEPIEKIAIEKTSTQDTNTTQQVPLVAQESSMPFSSSIVEKSH